ncbi:cyclopropane-fatty-acyl-phospholipid synthase [Mycobacterium haemophilum DSM 44634]
MHAIHPTASPNTRVLRFGRGSATQDRPSARGLLPSTKAIVCITERHNLLRTVDMTSLHPHYAETLRLWRERFMQRRDTLVHLGFDEMSGRMREVYLA